MKIMSKVLEGESRYDKSTQKKEDALEPESRESYQGNFINKKKIV